MARKPTTVSEVLRNAIETAGVSRYRLAKDSGVSPATLSRFVNGRSGVDLPIVDKLAAHLGLVLVKEKNASH